MALDIRDQLHPADHFRLTTDQFAAQQLVEPQTVRKQYSASGSYHGVRPVRLRNRKLLWPDNTIACLAAEQLGTTGPTVSPVGSCCHCRAPLVKSRGN
ncbi:hypothetical protein SRS16CHR_04798 [Variovorax sp. SRS16]|uniref:DNA-binding protein n=1 Tax=Variovorax sp. SRS16 TaxID=282217 RepID=UPI001315CD7E|nr:DNA-binding protein [Variovorax sp. SRS16]VTU31037.1 hypothetical protein SRS16CHR_04798 [Variovorax sp. SRS16]